MLAINSQPILVEDSQEKEINLLKKEVLALANQLVEEKKKVDDFKERVTRQKERES